LFARSPRIAIGRLPETEGIGEAQYRQLYSTA
jgi:hypothetical protein